MGDIVFLFKCLAAAVVSLLFLQQLLVHRKNLRNNDNFSLPPGPRPLPIIGNLHQLSSLPHQPLWRLARIHGPVLLVHLCHVPTVVLSSVEVAREVLRIHDLDTCSRPRLFCAGRLSYNYLDIAFAPYGDYWREMRKLSVLELLSTKRVDGFRFVREGEVKVLVEGIGGSARSGSIVDLSKGFLGLSAKIIYTTAFGKSFQGIGSNIGKEFMDIVHETMLALGSFSATDFFPKVGWIIDRFSGLHRRLEKTFHRLDSYYERIIDQHIQDFKAKPEGEDIVDLLLAMEKNETQLGNNFIFTRNNTKGILMVMIENASGFTLCFT